MALSLFFCWGDGSEMEKTKRFLRELGEENGEIIAYNIE
jgi:hypothetical protein